MQPFNPTIKAQPHSQPSPPPLVSPPNTQHPRVLLTTASQLTRTPQVPRLGMQPYRTITTLQLQPRRLRRRSPHSVNGGSKGTATLSSRALVYKMPRLLARQLKATYNAIHRGGELYSTMQLHLAGSTDNHPTFPSNNLIASSKCPRHCVPSAYVAAVSQSHKAPATSLIIRHSLKAPPTPDAPPGQLSYAQTRNTVGGTVPTLQLPSRVHQKYTCTPSIAQTHSKQANTPA